MCANMEVLEDNVVMARVYNKEGGFGFGFGYTLGYGTKVVTLIV